MTEYTSETLRALAGIGYCNCGFHGFFETLAHTPQCPYRLIHTHADAMLKLETQLREAERSAGADTTGPSRLREVADETGHLSGSTRAALRTLASEWEADLRRIEALTKALRKLVPFAESSGDGAIAPYGKGAALKRARIALARASAQEGIDD